MVPAIWPISELGAWEIIIVLVIAVVLFGNRLPQLGRSLGKGLVSFRKGVNEMKDELSKAANEPVDGDAAGDAAGDAEGEDKA